MKKIAAIAASCLLACGAAHSQAQPGSLDAAKVVAAEYMALIYQARESQLAFGKAEDDGGILSIPVRVFAVDRKTPTWDCRPLFVRNSNVMYGWQISNPRCTPASPGAAQAN
ncbi:hypothetical protein [Burkholderia gladioli]|uniref:hypothetical protein n=1 Tax=Burkholderia gladioli TaxID=28095 RepID=UPI001640D49E|nr:hypothetical protein [Burkholderia gladioli]